jgi:hypothetical protein
MTCRSLRLCRSRFFFIVGLFFFSLALIGTTRPALAQTSWHIEVVDDGSGTDTGLYSSLAFDRSGSFQIAYYNASRRTLQYAFREKQDQKWSRMAVASEGGMYVSLVDDAQGLPHMTFNSPLKAGLQYAHWDGKKWHLEVVDNVATQFATSIQLDASGNPHVTYFQLTHMSGNKVGNGNGQRLKYAYSDGTTWFTKTVALRPRQGLFNTLIIDTANVPHVAFAQSGHLQYATWDGSAWQDEDVDSTSVSDEAAGLGLSLALDSAGDPQLTYFDATKRTLKYAYRKAGVWKTEVVEDLSGTPRYPDSTSLKLDAKNQPRVAYYDSGSGVLKYAVRDGEKWAVEIVDRKGVVGLYPSLCLDAKGEPYISYYDSTNKQLRLAHPEAAAPAAATPAPAPAIPAPAAPTAPAPTTPAVKPEKN